MPEIPGDSRLPWVTLASERIYQNPWYALRQDRVRTHTGAEITYTYMEPPGAVAVVPLTLEGEIVLIRSYRHTVKDWCWEVPMGGRDTDDLETAARLALFLCEPLLKAPADFSFS